jgi:hypothetical protein
VVSFVNALFPQRPGTINNAVIRMVISFITYIGLSTDRGELRTLSAVVMMQEQTSHQPSINDRKFGTHKMFALDRPAFSFSNQITWHCVR